MEASEKIVSEQVKGDHLTELQRKVFETLRQMNVRRYCPSAGHIAENAQLELTTTKTILKELCSLGIVIWRVDTLTNDETYRLCKPEEFIKRERRAFKKGTRAAPNSSLPRPEIVSPKISNRVSTESIERHSPKILQCPKCDFVTRSYAGLQIHNGQKHKTAADIRNKIKLQELKAEKKEHAPNPPAKGAPVVMITLTVDEALDTSIALALADVISADRFSSAHKISQKLLKAIIKQVPQEDIEGAN